MTEPQSRLGEATPSSSGGAAPGLQMISSRGFTGWLAELNISLAASTYQAGAVLLLGVKPDGSLALYVSAFDRAMGLWSDGQSLWLGTLLGLWHLENLLPAGAERDGYDRCYVPRRQFVTGDVDPHDLAVDSEGRPVFVNTRFNCLATVDEQCSFRPLWQPSFISQMVPEDRCHLNGLALADGRPRYCTLVAESDVADGWRNRRADGGLLIDIETDTVLADGLAMPHSPRVQGDRIWLLEAGTGSLGWVPRSGGSFERTTFLPGFARGLALIGGYAVVGLSKPRREHAFLELPLQEELNARKAEPWCGLQVIDLASGHVAHWLRFEGVVQELFEVVTLPGVRRAQAMSLHTPNLHEYFTLPAGEQTRQSWIPPMVRRPSQG